MDTMTRLLTIGLFACGGAASNPAVPPLAVPEGEPSSPCIVVREEPAGIETNVEGTLEQDKDTFVLRLDHPRCVVGLKGSSVLVEVGIVSTGFDLRPMVGQKIRATGEAAPSTSSLGGPSVVVITSQVARP
jgi:hypothetical protein